MTVPLESEFSLKVLAAVLYAPYAGPVTALAFTPDDSYVLYSSGPNLCCYSVPEGKEICKAQLFERNRIHGIKVESLPEEIQVLIWGGPSFAILPLARLLGVDGNLRNGELIAHDWVLDARLLNSDTIALVTAHNTFITYSLTMNSFQQRFNCEEQSLLYAAQIHINPDNILVATGTVFNEIQLWRPTMSSSGKVSSSVVPIAQRLRGHEGCIFSLRFNADCTLLASCSDDRTIRVWDVNKGTFIAIGFAHIARVWDVQFLPTPRSEGIYLLSASEDTTALLWHLDPSERTLKVRERYQGHSGKHVWSEAISSNGRLAATGGNDGRVNLWDVGGWKDRLGPAASEVCWTEQTPKALVDGKPCFDTIKGYRCIDSNRLLVTTNSGCIWAYDLPRKEWSLMVREDRYKKYAVVGTFESWDDWVILGDAQGKAKLFQIGSYDQAFEWQALGVLVVAFYTTVSEGELYVLSQGAEISLSVISKDSNGFSLVSRGSVQLPFGFDVTSFLADPSCGVFFLGSRQGAIACYEISSCKLCGIWRRVHDEESVRSIRLHKVVVNNHSTEVMTTGRDSVYKILRIRLPAKFCGSLAADVVDGWLDGVEMQVVHRSLLNRGWLEGSMMIDANLLLWGFHSKKFSFWNETTGELIFEHQSGGANRIWDFYIPREAKATLRDAITGSWFVYTSKGELHFRRVGQNIVQRCINKGNHGREIRCMSSYRSESGEVLLASGSEDTYINFTKVVGDRLEFITRKKQFNTGIQALMFSRDGKVLFSSAGQKEVSVTPLRIEDRDLLSIEFGGYSDTSKSSEGETQRDEDDGGDLRIMDLDVRDQVIDDHPGYLIALVLSDSTVKLYWLDGATGDYSLIAAGRYTTCCLLGCKFIPNHDLLAVTATDGNIIFFRLPPSDAHQQALSWTFTSRFQAHQSGIKCIELVEISDSSIYVVTGGDDNAIQLTEVTINPFIICRTLATVSDAHTSTVTGVQFLGDSKYLSVGIDQKIRFWKYGDGVFAQISEFYTFVPDVCGVVDLGVYGEGRRLAVYGTGIELLALAIK